MTVLLHPRKDAPQRYRVWDKETRTQKYFPLTPKGLKEAEEYDKKVVGKRKKALALQRELPMQKLFHEDGRVKGLSRKARRYKNRSELEYLSVYANLNQIELYIGKRSFDDSYQQACQWILEQHGLEENHEIRQAFKKAKKFYWSSVKEADTGDSVPLWKQYFN